MESTCAASTILKRWSMGRICLTTLLLFLVGQSASAQTTHSVTLAATASADAATNPSLTYNVYKLNGACPAVAPTSISGSGFTKLNTAALTAPAFTDSGLAPGTYCYFMTAFLNATESIPSNTAQALVAPAAPTSLGITSIK